MLAHSLEQVSLFEFIERQWIQTDFSCLADNNIKLNKLMCYLA